MPSTSILLGHIVNKSKILSKWKVLLFSSTVIVHIFAQMSFENVNFKSSFTMCHFLPHFWEFTQAWPSDICDARRKRENLAPSTIVCFTRNSNLFWNIHFDCHSSHLHARALTVKMSAQIDQRIFSKTNASIDRMENWGSFTQRTTAVLLVYLLTVSLHAMPSIFSCQENFFKQQY